MTGSKGPRSCRTGCRFDLIVGKTQYICQFYFCTDDKAGSHHTEKAGVRFWFSKKISIFKYNFSTNYEFQCNHAKGWWAFFFHKRKNFLYHRSIADCDHPFSHACRQGSTERTHCYKFPEKDKQIVNTVRKIFYLFKILGSNIYCACAELVPRVHAVPDGRHQLGAEGKAGGDRGRAWAGKNIRK